MGLTHSAKGEGPLFDLEFAYRRVNENAHQSFMPLKHVLNINHTDRKNRLIIIGVGALYYLLYTVEV